jgi:glycosyltransferase involved in cell wall biosynthesis
LALASLGQEDDMTAGPKVSVVIPCFNHGEFLPEAVASVAASTERDDVEIIVVDDGSTDERTRTETDKLIAQGIRVIRQENQGLAAARNAAILASQGQYIFPLDADDRVRPGYIERGICVLDANPKVGIVYGDMEFFGEKTGRWVSGPFNPNRLMQQNYIVCSAVFRRVIWDQNGGYDGTMPVQGFEDWDFWLSAYEHGWQFVYVPEILFEYRQHRESMLTRGRKREADVARFVATKHAALYRQAWLQLAYEHDSGKATFHNLRRIVKSRIKQKLRINGDHG